MTEPARQLEPGFYRDTRNNATRYWDGSAWTTHQRRPDNPVGIIAAGIVVMVVGGVVAGFGVSGDEAAAVVIGYLATAIGSLLAMVGVVAQGVRLGNRYTDFERQLRAGGPDE